MKKIVNLLLAVCLCLSMAACGSQQSAESADAGNENLSNEETQNDASGAAQIQSIDETGEEADAAASDTLVVYFSSTGNTEAIAEHIASGLSADLYEITAETPYTDEDLNYNDNSSRSTVEMDDPSARPTISGTVENMEQYDTVYIGYPIWWGEAPRILATFVEAYDFTGKTVIPFCTSSSSGMGSSASGLEDLAGSGDWLEGERFSGNESAEEVMEWVNSL